MQEIEAIITWLIDGARSAATREAMIEELGNRLGAAGVPIERFAVFVTVLHPVIARRNFVWRRGLPVEMIDTGYDLLDPEREHATPFFRVRHSDKPVRIRLAEAAAPDGSAFLDQLRRDGFTDYFATPLHFSSGEIQVASWATQRPGGFSDDDQGVLAALAGPLARIVEAHSMRRRAVTLLNVYVGRQAGARVLAGHIRRGDTESIHAAIWLSDLRGFTQLAGLLPPQELIALLNRYFDRQVPAIEAHGGEVLKFMGDGLLAIFPIDGGGATAVCDAALAAAREARTGILDLERSFGIGSLKVDRGPGQPCGLALHLGEVLYGNVGGGRRLDFTVIGAAVNLAQRLERLSRQLDRIVIASADFAAACSEPLTPLGSYQLRGVAAAEAAFGLPEENPSAA